jgi:quercetin 2,3-dioxygenase
MKNKVRHSAGVIGSQTVMEGAGVKLMRVFGYDERKRMDPFLLLDHFGSSDPDDYMAGFPWHPHRGIETVTYMLEGEVEHGDSLGNKGVIGDGDIQWMTAGSGIIHQEMPKRYKGAMRGFQLWANLPAKDKMMDPRYRDIRHDQLPTIERNGVLIKVIAGEIFETKGPVRDIVIDPLYLDIQIPSDGALEIPVVPGYRVFAYVFEGESFFGPDAKEPVRSGQLVLLEDGNTVSVSAGKEGARFILVAGKPIGEPIAWGGPIVMNTEAELETAFEEYSDGTFIKKK